MDCLDRSKDERMPVSPTNVTRCRSTRSVGWYGMPTCERRHSDTSVQDLERNSIIDEMPSEGGDLAVISRTEVMNELDRNENQKMSGTLTSAPPVANSFDTRNGKARLTTTKVASER